jgi:hypothetical protein
MRPTCLVTVLRCDCQLINIRPHRQPVLLLRGPCRLILFCSAIEAFLDKLLRYHRRSFALSCACGIIAVLPHHFCSFALSGACGIIAVLRHHCQSFVITGACSSFARSQNNAARQIVSPLLLLGICSLNIS